MAEKILIIGGVALGPKAASRCKRVAPDDEITMIDENTYISYGGCGMPYYVSGEVQNMDSLRSTNAGAIRDPEFFRKMKGVNVLTRTRAQKIDRAKKTVLVEELLSGEKREMPYDKLVIATGSRARVPEIPGVTLKGVLSLTRLEFAEEIRKACEGGKITEAVIVGGGFIGLEGAVALADMWGVQVTVIEMMDQILPGVLSPTLAKIAEHDCRSHKVKVHTSEKVVRLEGDGERVSKVVTDKGEFPAQLVLFAAGFIPNAALAADAGLKIAPFGGIETDEYLRTSDPDIYAGGDCAAIKNIITGKYGYLPLGSMANRQGRVIGSNLAGLNETFPGYVGTWALKLFSLSFCGTGLTAPQAKKAGFDAIGVCIEQLDRAHFYPEKEMMTLELVVDKSSRRVLGLQGACKDGDAIKARIDAVAGVLEYAKPTINDISNLEVAYAPPFASAMDAVNTVANVADNVVSGRFAAITGDEFMELWRNRKNNNVFFIDMRPPKASKKIEAEYPEWHAIPLEEVMDRLSEIPKDRPVALVCNSGLRAYEGLLLLNNQGFKDVVNSMGGMQAVTKMGLKP
ncbi:MAG: FAD-dependent oxidoreductase [Desulfovibrio sp.]|nr:FAD-dependent oxidoreductase [Desulfovibrio sp.]